MESRREDFSLVPVDVVIDPHIGVDGEVFKSIGQLVRYWTLTLSSR